jgi:hypothetical protein
MTTTMTTAMTTITSVQYHDEAVDDNENDKDSFCQTVVTKITITATTMLTAAIIF